jgi:hypothetical protein
MIEVLLQSARLELITAIADIWWLVMAYTEFLLKLRTF